MAANGTGKLVPHYLLRALEDFREIKWFSSIIVIPWWIHVTDELVNRQVVIDRGLLRSRWSSQQEKRYVTNKKELLIVALLVWK